MKHNHAGSTVPISRSGPGASPASLGCDCHIWNNRRHADSGRNKKKLATDPGWRCAKRCHAVKCCTWVPGPSQYSGGVNTSCRMNARHRYSVPVLSFQKCTGKSNDVCYLRQTLALREVSESIAVQNSNYVAKLSAQCVVCLSLNDIILIALQFVVELVKNTRVRDHYLRCFA